MARYGIYTMQTAARMLGIGPNRLFARLRDMRILNRNNIPYRRYIDQGYFTVHRGEWHHHTIGRRHYARTLVTDKGINWLEGIVARQGMYSEAAHSVCGKR